MLHHRWPVRARRLDYAVQCQDLHQINLPAQRHTGRFGVHHYRHHHFPALFALYRFPGQPDSPQNKRGGNSACCARALESDDDDNDERQMIRHLSSNSGSLKEFRSLKRLSAREVPDHLAFIIIVIITFQRSLLFIDFLVNPILLKIAK
jgi:hypothetical protein